MPSKGRAQIPYARHSIGGHERAAVARSLGESVGRAGAAHGRFRARARACDRRTGRGRGVEWHRGAARRARGARRRSRRRGHRSAAHLRRDRERRARLRRDAGLRRRRTRHAQSRSGRGRARDHAAHARRDSGALCGASRRRRRHRGRARSAPLRARGRLPRARRDDRQTQRRRTRRRRVLFVPPGEGDHDRRRRRRRDPTVPTSRVRLACCAITGSSASAKTTWVSVCRGRSAPSRRARGSTRCSASARTTGSPSRRRRSASRSSRASRRSCAGAARSRGPTLPTSPTSPRCGCPRERRGVRSAWHLYAVRVRHEALRGGRAALFDALRARGIGVQVHYVPVHLQPFYREHLGHRWGAFPVAESAYLELLSLPLFPTLSARDRDRVVATLLGEIARLRR